ncbi:hypothetical protein ABZP36_016687 [Zizania latifolia]
MGDITETKGEMQRTCVPLAARRGRPTVALRAVRLRLRGFGSPRHLNQARVRLLLPPLLPSTFTPSASHLARSDRRWRRRPCSSASAGSALLPPLRSTPDSAFMWAHGPLSREIS